jgi:hypothetical protein
MDFQNLQDKNIMKEKLILLIVGKLLEIGEEINSHNPVFLPTSFLQIEDCNPVKIVDKLFGDK